MNASTNIPSDTSRDPDFIGAEAAMHRAAKVAAIRAESVNRRHNRAETVDDSNEVSTRRNRELRNLSFSQAQGYEELPQPLKLEELPKEARVHIWDIFHEFMRIDGYLDDAWSEILWNVHCWHDHRSQDEWDGRDDVLSNDMKSRIYQLPFNKVFDLLQFVMRRPECPDELPKAMKEVFERCRLAYTISEDQPPTIIPAITMTEGGMIVASLSELDRTGLTGSASHLRKSAERINNSEWADSIRESIHAVESVARQIAPNKSQTLTEALKSIDKHDSLHPALKSAFEKLYAYTSDENGIRHALLDGEVSNVDRNEAIFMLGACASFASYLSRKHEVSEAS